VLVRLHVAALAPGVVGELPGGLVERYVNRGVDVLMVAILRRRTVDDELGARHRKVDSDAVLAPVPVMTMRLLDGDAAPHDTVEEGLELGKTAADVVVQSFGTFHLSIGDLHRNLHLVLRTLALLVGLRADPVKPLRAGRVRDG
jgi:hypothetical protein